MYLSHLTRQFMNQARQAVKMESTPGGNPVIRTGMQPGMGGQVCRQYFICNVACVHSTRQQSSNLPI